MANKTFPQFTKTIVQLPIPSSTLTKAEYKAKYGIDLNAIDFPKIIVLIDGKDKYPVDEVKINGSTTEIYAGGKILSIGSSNVSVTSSAYSVANAKPIYYHPIYMDSTGDKFRLTFVILDNNPDAYTNATCLAKLKELMDLGAVIQVNGFVKGSDDKLSPAFIMFKRSATEYAVYYHNDSSVVTGDIESIIWPNITTFIDGVNKIN